MSPKGLYLPLRKRSLPGEELGHSTPPAEPFCEVGSIKTLLFQHEVNGFLRTDVIYQREMPVFVILDQNREELETFIISRSLRRIRIQEPIDLFDGQIVFRFIPQNMGLSKIEEPCHCHNPCHS